MVLSFFEELTNILAPFTGDISPVVDEGPRICLPKFLPPELEIKAAVEACVINPMNAPGMFLPQRLMDLLEPADLAVATMKYHGAKGVDLSVSFLDNPPADLRAKILTYANLWGAKGANIKFRESTSQGQIRIARTPNDGYWSYMGTDIFQIPAGQPTMNLANFTMSTPDQEFSRVVPHEFGHSCGFPHEHARRELVELLDPEKTIQFFKKNYGWSANQTRAQVLTPLENGSLMFIARPDQRSVMCYDLPAACTKNGVAIVGGSEIVESDYQAADKFYPGKMDPNPPPPPPPPVEKLGHVIVHPNSRIIEVYGGWTVQTKPVQSS